MMINEMKDSRSSDLLHMFYDCQYFSLLMTYQTTWSSRFKEDNSRRKVKSVLRFYTSIFTNL